MAAPRGLRIVILLYKCQPLISRLIGLSILYLHDIHELAISIDLTLHCITQHKPCQKNCAAHICDPERLQIISLELAAFSTSASFHFFFFDDVRDLMWISMIFGQVLLEFNYEELFTKACGCQEELDGIDGIKNRVGG